MSMLEGMPWYVWVIGAFLLMYKPDKIWEILNFVKDLFIKVKPADPSEEEDLESLIEMIRKLISLKNRHGLQIDDELLGIMKKVVETKPKKKLPDE
jgi:hypothetical protein